MNYSQNNEQALILSYFQRRVGNFLDLGANDGKTLSNTYELSQLGWSGVCVEPSPLAFERLRALHRQDVQCINVAVGSTTKSITLHQSWEHMGSGDVALLSTAVDIELARWATTPTAFEPIEVECLSFPDLLSRCGSNRFNLISMDIEGMELEVLEQMDLSALGCEMLLVEVNERDPTPYLRHAKGYGLKLKTRTPENLILIR